MPKKHDPVSIADAMNNAIERHLNQREREEAIEEEREEARRNRRPQPRGVDHSTHVCNTDPADPWSECTVERPW